MGRAERRHHKERVKKKIKRVIRSWWLDRTEEEVEHLGNKLADNPKVCDGPCCKNPRRSGWESSDGKTRKELMNEKDLKDFKDGI